MDWERSSGILMLLVLASRSISYSFYVALPDHISMGICIFHQDFNNFKRQGPGLKIFVQNIWYIVGTHQGFAGQLVDGENGVKALPKMKVRSLFHS